MRPIDGDGAISHRLVVEQVLEYLLAPHGVDGVLRSSYAHMARLKISLYIKMGVVGTLALRRASV